MPPVAESGWTVSAPRYGNDAVRVIYDIPNAFFIGEDFAAGLQQCRARLELVHLSDTGRQVYRHDPVGLGTVPFAQVPAALAAAGYTKSRCWKSSRAIPTATSLPAPPNSRY